jgi:hypothetical protein
VVSANVRDMTASIVPLRMRSKQHQTTFSFIKYDRLLYLLHGWKGGMGSIAWRSFLHSEAMIPFLV